MIALLFNLIAGHFVADYPLQTDFIAKGKSPYAAPQFVPWYYVLTAHAFTHGLMVSWLTGEWLFGVLETFLHWFIDLAKCCNQTSIHTDQALHILCKVMWVSAIWIERIHQ